MSITYNRPDPRQPGWAESGEAVKPANADIAVGWPASQIPPARQEFNWLDQQQDKAIKYILRKGIAEWNQYETYQGGGLVIASNGSIYWNLVGCTGAEFDPVFDNTGKWELTAVRLADADARYMSSANAANMLTIQMGDARYQLRGDYVTFAVGDQRYVLAANMGQYVTFPLGDIRYALRSDLSLYETVAHAAATYLTITDANSRFAALAGGATVDWVNGRIADVDWAAQQYATNAANNMNASVRAWVTGILPGLQFSTQSVSNPAGSLGGRYFIITAAPNNAAPRSFCFGNGSCQEGDVIPVPAGFNVGNMNFGGYIQSIPSADSVGGDSLLNVVFSLSGATVTQCRFHKSNAGTAWWSRGYAYGSWYAFGFN